MSSVWSRVGIGSMTVVWRFAFSPARRTADFTWALATGNAYSIPFNLALPWMTTGGSPFVVSIFAPIRLSGSATRSMGRVRSDSSPVTSKRPAWPARIPVKSRISVPAFPASMGSSGA